MLASKLLLQRRAILASSHLTKASPACYYHAPFSGMVSMRQFSADFKPSPSLVKQLRDMTGSPLKDCMSVLKDTQGDLQASKDLLRKKGLAFAEKRAHRDATEGLIGLMECKQSNVISMIQFSCETDFVAKTDRFRDALDVILRTVHGQETLNVGMDKTRD